MKKLISLVMMILLLVSLCVSVQGFSDTVGLACEKATNLLEALGIAEGITADEFAPDETLTRAELTTFAMRARGFGDDMTGEDVFADVTAEHWAYAAITTAYKQGIVTGVDEINFYPDAKVTAAQAVKMMVCALGYGVEAESMGGFPVGYMAKANILDLLKGLSLTADEEITRGQAAMLIANAIDTAPLVPDGYGDGWDGRYHVAKGETMLSYYSGIYKFEGKVTSTYMIDLTGVQNLQENQLAISGTVFTVGEENEDDINVEEWLGFEAEIYAVRDDDSLIIRHIRKKQRDARTVQVNGEDILYNTDAGTIYYENAEGRKQTLSIGSGAKLVKNGDVKPSFTALDLQSRTSDYSFVINNGNVDLILQYDFETHIIKSVSEAQEKVFFKDGDSMELGANKFKKLSFVDSDGDEAEVVSSSEWDVLEIAKNTAGNVAWVILGIKKAEGVIKEISDSEVYLEEERYRISPFFKSSGASIPSLGDSVSLSLDRNGRIAAVNTDILTENYAFAVASEMGKGFDAKLRIKLFMPDGKMEVMEVADKVLYNGTVTEGIKLIDKAPLFSGGVFARQLITYKKTEDNVLTEINTAIDGSSMKWDERINVFSKDFYIAPGDAAGRFNGMATMTLATRYRITKKTLGFIIPPDASAADNQYGTIGVKNFVHDQFYTDVYLYDVDKDNNVSVFLQFATVSKTVDSQSELVGVVSAIGIGLDKDGNVASTLELMQGRTKKVFTLADDIEIELKNTTCIVDNKLDPLLSKSEIKATDIDQGDVVQYMVDRYGNITALAIRFRNNYPVDIEKAIHGTAVNNPSDTYNYYSLQYLYGTLNRPVDDGVVLNVPLVANDYTKASERLFTANSLEGRAILVHKRSRKCEAVKIEELVEGDKIFVSRRLAGTTLIAVYRND